MPDLDNTRNSPYEFLQRMSTEKLKSIVRADFESEEADDTANDEFITCVLEVIAQREESNPNAPHFDVETGWKSFQDRKSLNSVTDEALPPDAIQDNRFRENQSQNDIESSRPKRTGHRAMRSLIIAAVIMWICAAAASAFEINIFKMFAQWTQEIFQFQSETVSGAGLEYDTGIRLNSSQTLQDTLEEYGVIIPVSPTWIPQGFQLNSLNSYTDVDSPLFSALYDNQDTSQTILVSAIIHTIPQPALHEKDTDSVEIFSVSGTEHYIIGNNDLLTALWFADNVECSISGNITEDEMKTMINSIYEE